MLGKIISQISRYRDKHKFQDFFLYLGMLIVASILFSLIGYDIESKKRLDAVAVLYIVECCGIGAASCCDICHNKD